MPADEKYIQELTTDREEHFDKLHTEMRECTSLRFREHTVAIPKAYETSTQVVKTSIIEDMLLRVVSTLTTEEPQVICPPAGDTEKAKSNGSLKERHAMASLTRMQAEVQRPVFRMGVDAAAAKGLGVWKMLQRVDAWNGMQSREQWWSDLSKEERAEVGARNARSLKASKPYTEYTQDYRKGAAFPILWTDVDPLCYYPVRGAYGIEEVLEITDRALRPAMERLRVRKVQVGNDWGWERVKPGEPMPQHETGGGRMVKLSEHWTKSHVTYCLDGKLADQIEHGYGFIPYYDFSGHSTSERDPIHAHQSVIAPFRHLVPVLDRLLTMKTNWAYLAAWPFMVKDETANDSLMPTDANGKEAEVVTQIATGSILRGVKFMEPPKASADLDQLIEIVRLMIDRSGLASVMYGSGASGSSGYMVSQLMTAAQLVYRPILANAEMALERMVADMWRMIERVIGTEVYVWGASEEQGQRAWLGLGPKEIKGYYAVNVKIKPVLPMDEIARGDAAQRWTGRKELISWQTALDKYLGIQAPEEEIRRVRVEKLMDDPRINDPIAFDAAVDAGVIKPPEQSAPAGPPLPMLPPPVPLGPDGMPIGGVPGANGMTGAAPIMGPQPSVPGVTQPLVPPAPAGAGMPVRVPVGVQRGPGGPNLGPGSGVV